MIRNIVLIWRIVLNESEGLSLSSQSLHVFPTLCCRVYTIYSHLRWSDLYLHSTFLCVYISPSKIKRKRAPVDVFNSHTAIFAYFSFIFLRIFSINTFCLRELFFTIKLMIMLKFHSAVALPTCGPAMHIMIRLYLMQSCLVSFLFNFL